MVSFDSNNNHSLASPIRIDDRPEKNRLRPQFPPGGFDIEAHEIDEYDLIYETPWPIEQR
jgi:hypothetical protein